MMVPLLKRLQALQEHLLEAGLARSVLALPAPRMLSLPSPSSEEAGYAGLYSRTVTETEIVEVSRDLFASGHHSLAVQEAFKAVEKFVQSRASAHSQSGTALMETVFSANRPRLYWSERLSQSQKDEQRGYMHLYAGSMLGIRNPVTHEFGWVDEGETALELILFAQHLLRKAKVARVATASGSIEKDQSAERD